MPFSMLAAGGTKAAIAAPAWLGPAMADAALAAAGASAYSSYQQGQYAEAVGTYNMDVAQSEAESAKLASEEERRDLAIERRKTLATQLTQFAKGGVIPSAGTPLKIQEETAGLYTRDIGKLRYGYNIARGQALSQGALESSYGRQRKRASRWMSGTSLLTGAGMALDYRYRYT